MCLCMASRHAKCGRRLRPAIGGRPSGTNDVACVCVCVCVCVCLVWSVLLTRSKAD